MVKQIGGEISRANNIEQQIKISSEAVMKLSELAIQKAGLCGWFNFNLSFE